MLILKTPITLKKIQSDCNHFFQEMVKIVVDTEKRIIALDAELHADLEEELLNQGSHQENLWGANIYFNKAKEESIEFTSLINIRPAQNNRSMEIIDPHLKNLISQIIWQLILYV